MRNLKIVLNWRLKCRRWIIIAYHIYYMLALIALNGESFAVPSHQLGNVGIKYSKVARSYKCKSMLSSLWCEKLKIHKILNVL